ncbi:MAG: hypothetical protein JRI25_01945 [Deltaproteobacteria bacterium]|nr:hypothetical protein [Deltaproteobacteria bacterium]MBW2253343.1 hypothetical protein [Deltaproteobacteria bacterium]
MRLLRETQKGNPIAFRSLLEPYLPGIWSICRGFCASAAEATEVVLGFRDDLHGRLRAFHHDRAFGVQLYSALWQYLTEDLEPPRGLGIQAVYPAPGKALRPPGPDDDRIIREILAMTPPIPRLVYLFWMITDLDAGRLAQMLGVPEMAVREARANVTARIQEGLSQ